MDTLKAKDAQLKAQREVMEKMADAMRLSKTGLIQLCKGPVHYYITRLEEAEEAYTTLASKERGV